MFYDKKNSSNPKEENVSSFYSSDLDHMKTSDADYEKIGKDSDAPVDYDRLGISSYEPRQSISNVYPVSRKYGNFENSGIGMRQSLVGFKDGIPGSYSGYKLKYKQQTNLPHSKNIPVKNKLPLNTKEKSSTPQVVGREYCQKSMDSTQNIIIDNSGKGQETGIRYYDPSNDPKVPVSAILLPISSRDELSDEYDAIEETYTPTVEDQKDEIYDIIGEPQDDRESIDGNYVKVSFDSKPSVVEVPPLPPRNSAIFYSSDETDLDKDTYIRVDIDIEQEPLQLPSLADDVSVVQVKRHGIIRSILENEKMYMKILKRLVKEYEEPLYKRQVIAADRIKVIFKYVDEIMQCHQLFNMALSDRLKEWNEKDIIGDVIYASFSKSMAVKAYSSFVGNFTVAMDSIKETSKLVPTFLNFLKYHLYRNSARQSLYDLMQQPLERIPQLVILLKALLQVTPLEHADHLPLQMALTQIECLSDMLLEKHKDSMLKHKVYDLDNSCTGLSKPLASKSRYCVRHDDMLLCRISDGEIVKKKLHRLFLLNDLLICASHLNKQKQTKLMTDKRYKIKWCLPLNDIELIEFGSGISVDIDEKTTTIKYPKLAPSPRPGYKKKSLEDLQHDIAIIGEISGKVASLRRSYKIINEAKVKRWYDDVKQMLERETALANMNWIELSIPVRDSKDERLSCLFNALSPRKKIEWTAELENAKLRLSHLNNPGWYLQEENMYAGETAVLRRTVPLLTKTLALFTPEPKMSVQYCIEATSSNSKFPLIWIFLGNDHISYAMLLELSMASQPHVIETFVVCESRVCCGEIVPSRETNSTSIWLGTMAGIIVIIEELNTGRKIVTVPKLKDTITSINYFSRRKDQLREDLLFNCIDPSHICALNDLSLSNPCHQHHQRINSESWDLVNPTIVCLCSQSLMSLVETSEKLWCACGSDVFVLDPATLGIKNKLKMSESSKSYVRHLVCYGIGVWVSLWKSAKLQLIHAETFEHLQTISITATITRMKNDIDGRIQSMNVDNLYVTSLFAKEGLLWVGVDQGLVLTYPLPRLGGIPTVSGLACVSFHGHDSAVKQFYSFELKSFTEKDIESNPDTQVLEASGDLVDSSESCDPDAQPVYYVVEPESVDVAPINPKDIEHTQESQPDCQLDEVDETTVEEAQENDDDFGIRRPRVYSSNSDDSINADQEFSFIETMDKKNLRKNVLDNQNEIVNVVPELKRNGFAEMMSQFQGFETPSTPSNELSANTREKDLTVIKEEISKEEENDDMENEISINLPIEQMTDISSESVDDKQCRNSITYESPIDRNADDSKDVSIRRDEFQEVSTDNKTLDISTNSNNNESNLQPNSFEQAQNAYRSFSLPQSPDISEDLDVSPPRRVSKSKQSNDGGEYTPLKSINGLDINVSDTDVWTFDQKSSLDSKNEDKEFLDYASLVDISERHEHEKKYLLNPRFIFSIGMGHQDLRTRRRASSSLDFFRSSSTTDREPLLLIWKLT